MRTFNQQIGNNIALNTNYTSAFVPLKNIFMYSIAANISGTPTGNIKLQASNDPETNDTQPLVTPVNWLDIDGSIATVSSSGEVFWNVHEVAYNYVRVLYTDTSGGTSLATLNIIFNGKGA